MKEKENKSKQKTKGKNESNKKSNEKINQINFLKSCYFEIARNKFNFLNSAD